MLMSIAIFLSLLPVAVLPIVVWLHFQNNESVNSIAPKPEYDNNVRLNVERLLLYSDAFARDLRHQDEFEECCYELGIELMENFDIKMKKA